MTVITLVAVCIRLGHRWSLCAYAWSCRQPLADYCGQDCRSYSAVDPDCDGRVDEEVRRGSASVLKRRVCDTGVIGFRSPVVFGTRARPPPLIEEAALRRLRVLTSVESLRRYKQREEQPIPRHGRDCVPGARASTRTIESYCPLIQTLYRS